MSTLHHMQDALIKIITTYHYLKTAEEPSSDLSQEHQLIATLPIDLHLPNLIEVATEAAQADRPLLNDIFINIQCINSLLLQTEPLQLLFRSNFLN